MALRDDGNHPTLLPLMLGGGSAAERCAPRGSASITARADRAWSVRPGAICAAAKGPRVRAPNIISKFARVVAGNSTPPDQKEILQDMLK